MCSRIPVGGRDLGCFVEPGMSSGLLGVEVAILNAFAMFLGLLRTLWWLSGVVVLVTTDPASQWREIKIIFCEGYNYNKQKVEQETRNRI